SDRSPRRLAERSSPHRAGARADRRRAAGAADPVVPGPSPGRAPRSDRGGAPGERPDDAGEAKTRAGPRVAGGPGPAERAADRGAPCVASPDRHRAGCPREEAGAQHPRRSAAATRGPVSEAAPGGAARVARSRQVEGDARGAADRYYRDAGGASRPRARDLSAAP